MELKINELDSVSQVTAGERLYLNADGDKVVPESSAEAATLFATEGDEISRADALKFGLVKPTAAEKKAAAAAAKDEEPADE